MKAGKLFATAMGVMEEKDLTSIKERILETAAENNFEILELAAALMQMSIGDEPEEIQVRIGKRRKTDKSGRKRQRKTGERQQERKTGRKAELWKKRI